MLLEVKANGWLNKEQALLSTLNDPFYLILINWVLLITWSSGPGRGTLISEDRTVLQLQYRQVME